MTVYTGGKVIWTDAQQQGWRFKLYCWVVFQWWWQPLLIPYYIIMGMYYGYSAREIARFCSKCIFRREIWDVFQEKTEM